MRVYDYTFVPDGLFENLVRFVNGYMTARVARAVQMDSHRLTQFRTQKGALRIMDVAPLCKHFGIAMKKADGAVVTDIVGTLRGLLIKEKFPIAMLVRRFKAPSTAIDSLAGNEKKGSACMLDRMMAHYGYVPCDIKGEALEAPPCRNYGHQLRYDEDFKVDDGFTSDLPALPAEALSA